MLSLPKHLVWFAGIRSPGGASKMLRQAQHDGLKSRCYCAVRCYCTPTYKEIMGFWSFRFGKSVKRSPAEDYFEFEYYFTPSGEQIEISVTGELGILTQQQEDFVTRVENEYSLIVGAIIPAIEDEFRNWKPDFKIVDFEREFKLVHLDIPTCAQQPVEWEMSFETIHDLNHIVVVSMLDFQLLHIHIDG